jgi:integrase
MEYLQASEVNSLLRVAYEHNREHHLVLLALYATGTRISQCLRLQGNDVYTDAVTGETRIRLPRAKRGTSRSYKLVKSADPLRDLTPIIALAKIKGNSRLFKVSRFYLHVVIKKYAALAGLHSEMVHIHTLRHSTAMRIYEKTQRPGAITGFLCHTDEGSVYPYLREHDASIAEDAMAAVLTAA